MFNKRISYQITATAPEGPFAKALDPIYKAIGRVLSAFSDFCGVGLIPGTKYQEYVNNPQETCFPQNGRRLVVKAGENLSYGTPVSLTVVSSDITANKAIAADAPDTRPCHAVVIGPAALSGDLVEVAVGAALVQSSGLTPGSYYWLSQTTAGTLRDTAPSSGFSQLIGFAISSTVLFISIEECGVPGEGGGGGAGFEYPAGFSIFGETTTAPSGFTLVSELPEVTEVVELSPLPSDTSSNKLMASMLLADGRVIAIGGTTNDRSSRTSRVRFGTISGDTISWVLSTNYPTTIDAAAVVQLSDGRICVAGGTSSGVDITTVYFGTISGNAITWAAGTALPGTKSQHVMKVLSNGNLAVFGGADSNVYTGVISGNSITWTNHGLVGKVGYSPAAIDYATDKFITLGGDSGTCGASSDSIVIYDFSVTPPTSSLSCACHNKITFGSGAVYWPAAKQGYIFGGHNSLAYPPSFIHRFMLPSATMSSNSCQHWNLPSLRRYAATHVVKLSDTRILTFGGAISYTASVAATDKVHLYKLMYRFTKN